MGKDAAALKTFVTVGTGYLIPSPSLVSAPSILFFNSCSCRHGKNVAEVLLQNFGFQHAHPVS